METLNIDSTANYKTENRTGEGLAWGEDTNNYQKQNVERGDQKGCALYLMRGIPLTICVETNNLGSWLLKKNLMMLLEGNGKMQLRNLGEP